MEYDELFERILTASSIDAAAELIEANLAPEDIDAELLNEMRAWLLEGDEAQVLRGMLVSARGAPVAVAAATDAYGLWVARSRLRETSPELLRVAAWAYRWARDDSGYARALVNLSEALYVKDRFEEAQRDAVTAQLIFEQLPGAEAGIARSLLIQGLIFYEQQEAGNALNRLLGAYELLEHQPLSGVGPPRVETLIALGFVAEDLQDDFTAAEQRYQEIATLLATHPQGLGSRFRLHLNYGYLCMRLGRHGDACFHFDAAAAIVERQMDTALLSDEDHYDLLLAQLTQALMLADTLTARRHLATLNRLLPADRRSIKQQAEADLFTALLLPHTEAAKAVLLLEQAAESFASYGADLLAATCRAYLVERAYQADNTLQARTDLNRVRALLAGHKTPRRLLDLDRIAAQYDPDMSADERATIAHRLLAAQEYPGAAAVYQALGTQYERTGQPGAARTAYTEAIAAARAARGLVRLTPHSLSLLEARRRAFERAFVLAAGEDGALAFAVLEQAHAQVLLDTIMNAGIWKLLDRAELAELRTAYACLEQERARHSLRITRTRRPGLRDELPGEGLRDAEQAYFAALATLETRKVMEAGWISGAPRPAVEIAAALPPGGLLAAYTLADQPDDAGQELWVTTLTSAGVCQSLRAASAGQWQGFAGRWAAQPLLTMQTAGNEQAALELLNELYGTFIGPIQSQLAQAGNLVIVLDERLALYPLHAGYYRRRKTYLIEQLPVSYAPGGSILAVARSRRAGRTNSGSIVLAGWDATDEPDYTPLPAVRQELALLAERLGTEPLHGPLAPDEILSRITDARLVHLSCHGNFPADTHPRFANLVLGRPRLYADDLYRADTSADLVFLNACDSGRHGPGLQGMVSAALVAGASSVIAAMWEVEQSVGRELAEHFYTHWLAGTTFAEALRQAQLELLRGRWPHPAHWAPFYLTGLPDP